MVEAGLRSEREDRWRDALPGGGQRRAGGDAVGRPRVRGRGGGRLGAALGRVLDRLGDGDRALAVGHSPTNEAAVLGLTGDLVAPLAKGAGVLITEDQGTFRVDPVEP